MQQQPNKTAIFNWVANAARMAMLLIALAEFVGIRRVYADGGVVQFEKSAGPFVITVFTTPAPLRAGPVDISLMVQSRENRQPVLDCQVFAQLHKEGAMSVRSEATHEAARNKLLYAAQMNIPEPGLWEIEVIIRQGDDSTHLAGELSVAPSNPVLLVYWRSLALPPLFISLFAVNQWLKRRSANGDKQ
jgi:hypothetical protein